MIARVPGIKLASYIYFCETNSISQFGKNGFAYLFLRNEPNFSVASRRSSLPPHRERNGFSPMKRDADIGRGQGAESKPEPSCG
jgi:hypothetical protein